MYESLRLYHVDLNEIHSEKYNSTSHSSAHFFNDKTIYDNDIGLIFLTYVVRMSFNYKL